MGEYTSHYITRHRVAVHFPGSCSLQLTDGKKLDAVLSNFRSQYFRYFAAKCDLNTPALCLGWAQIHSASEKWVQKGGFIVRWNFTQNFKLKGRRLFPLLSMSPKILKQCNFHQVLLCFCPIFLFFAIVFFSFPVQLLAFPKKLEHPPLLEKESVKWRLWLLTFSFCFCIWCL